MPEHSDPDIIRIEMLMKERIRARERRERTTRLRVALVAMVASVVGIFASFYGVFELAKTKPKSQIPEVTKEELSVLKSNLDELRRVVEEVRIPLLALQQAKPESLVAVEQAKLSSRIELVDIRIGAVESAILESPERALSIPLLRKDVGDLSKRSEEYRVLIKSDIDRLYAQQTWMLGGIGTVLLAIAGGAITIVLKSLPRSSKNED